MTFLESGLQFDFTPTNWRVMKYDTHRYFKILSGAGLKGIDFIGIHKEEALIFFEVKHFRTNNPNSKTTFLIFDDTALFIQNITAKMEDTITAIKVIIKYLNRKAWYRYFLKLEQYIPSQLLQQKDWYFWHQIHQLRSANTSNSFVIWLEIDSDYSEMADDTFWQSLQSKLTQELEQFNIRPILANRKTPVFSDDLNVKKGT